MMDNLLAQVYTTDDLAAFTKSVGVLTDSLYKIPEDGGSKAVPPGVNPELYQNFLKAPDRKAFLAGLAQALERAEVVGISLSFTPGTEFSAELGRWAKAKFGVNSVIKVNHDASLVGGIIVEKGGRVLDLSVAKMFASLGELGKT